MIYFTSDLHLGHKNIIRFDSRPFLSIEEMDQTIIKKWNSKVKPEDTVYILGDISWYNDKTTADIVSGLNGSKILIMGNHDKIQKHGRLKLCFDEITGYKEINMDEGRHITLCHYPIVFFNQHHHGAYMFYGHVHNSNEWGVTENYRVGLEQLDIKCNMYNVGCMVWDYEPVTFDEIIAGYKSHNRAEVKE